MQVQGRALLAGAAMFEMGAAAGTSLSAASPPAGPLLSQASIAGPCQLSVPDLSCLIMLRYRSLRWQIACRQMGCRYHHY